MQPRSGGAMRHETAPDRGSDRAATFEELVAEGAAVPLEGWDFSWFEGRATEERPPWGYARLMAERLAAASAALDIETGGGEVLATAARWPDLLVATESWPPNVAVARDRLEARGGDVVACADAPSLPFRDMSFDLVTSRHPVVVLWEEIARVLRPGGTYLSQQIGPGSNRELTDFMMGPQPVNAVRSPEWAVAEAQAAGLHVVEVLSCAPRVEFFDIGAVVHFLRKVHWTVPGFAPEDYEGRLRELHGVITREGSFVSHAQRLLIEARRPG
jgi:SAM-dependent methyltransferase